MIRLGLALAERLLNSYIYDMNPSVRTRHTTYKMGEIFQKEIRPFLDDELRMPIIDKHFCTEQDEKAVYANSFCRGTKKITEWTELVINRHLYMPTCDVDPLKHELPHHLLLDQKRDDLVIPGPVPMYFQENRGSEAAELEIWIELNTK